jgi:hypothetical protein
VNINIVITRLTPHIKAMTTPNDDGTYTIIVNDHLPREEAIKEIVHELTHIEGNDFSAEAQAPLLEEMVRRNTEDCDLGKFNFFYHYVSA